ncbi:hypothetical protein PTT_10379 [Pyrenophora teres f. teres 0-1]|uniref:Uncharacterized protein n=1 Tax=Pyrenophora teres f. teres (strain 0-1) TaxID=861557 RepID=E3RP47_PYRTT|nr:hypothetical protein PTT_10379 [Pyrenophora teres f. teres 0-1]
MPATLDSLHPSSSPSTPTQMTSPYPDDARSARNSTFDMPDHHDYVSPILTTNSCQHNLRQLPPYPLYEDDHEADIYGGHGDFFRLPIGEDDRSRKPLPPSKIYDSDQDLPVIDPGLYLPEASDAHHDDAQPNASEHSQTELALPPRLPSAASETLLSDHSSPAVRVPTMRSDMYQPTMGGLHRLSTVQRKGSKRDRIKRFMCGLKPFHRG